MTEDVLIPPKSQNRFGAGMIPDYSPVSQIITEQRPESAYLPTMAERSRL
jgi:hypothetical protein